MKTERPSPTSYVQEVFDYFNGQMDAMSHVYSIALKNGGNMRSAVQKVKSESSDLESGWYEYGFKDRLKALDSSP